MSQLFLHFRSRRDNQSMCERCWLGQSGQLLSHIVYLQIKSFNILCTSPPDLMLRMAHRLTSHHRALFSPKYLSGTSAYITTTAYFRAPFDVKDKDDFEKRVLASAKPVLVDFHAEYEFLLFPLKCSFSHSNLLLLANTLVTGMGVCF